MKIITIANQKGGTGKSTSAAALAQAAEHRGFKTLAVDLDPQGNLSFFLDADTSGRYPGSFDLLEGKPAAEIIQKTEWGIDTIAASWNLQTVSSSRGSARRLKNALSPIAGLYDLIVIDTPPTAGELQYNALMASTDLIIPIQADILSLQGLYQMADTANQIKRNNPGLRFAGIIFTRHGGRSTLARQMEETIKEKANGMEIPFLLSIREAVAIREAQTLQQNLFQYAPNSKPAQDYMKLLELIAPSK